LAVYVASIGDRMTDTVANMLQLARHVCGTQTARLRAALQRLLRKPDEEAVHDVRVACRRLRVALGITRKLFGADQAEAIRTRLKELLTLLGGTRDAEVLAARAEKLAESGDRGAAELLRILRPRTEQQRRATARRGERSALTILPEQIERLIARRPAGSKGALKHQAMPVAQRAERVLAKRMRTLWQFAELDSESHATELHQLRIEMKKLRYAAEFFGPALVPEKTAKAKGGPAHKALPGRAARHPLKTIVKIAEGYQELLGNLHDAAVAEETLTKWQRDGLPWDAPVAGGKDEARCEPVLPLQALLKAARKDQTALRREFGKGWGAKLLKKLERTVKALGS